MKIGINLMGRLYLHSIDADVSVEIVDLAHQTARHGRVVPAQPGIVWHQLIWCNKRGERGDLGMCLASPLLCLGDSRDLLNHGKTSKSLGYGKEGMAMGMAIKIIKFFRIEPSN